MLDPLEDLPAGVIGYRAVGTIEASDYRDVLTPAFDAAFEEYGRIDWVLIMGDEFDHLSLGGMLEDAKFISMPHEAWGRSAFVTNHEVLSGIATAFGGLVPGEFRVFPLEQQAHAVAWVAAGPRDAAGAN
jgi:hypothetical protein